MLASALALGSVPFAGAAANAAPEAAPDAALADAADAGGTIVVLGNRARGTTVIESPAPIDVIDSTQLESLGANTSLRDALSVLLPSFNQLTVGSASWNSVTRPAGLRGLGGAHLLVLVNGKRRHNSSLLNLSTGSVDQGSNPVDLDLIPTAAIARIEVLRDGAAAQYGSDAIAGVINIILKDNAEGGTLSVNAGQRYSYNGKTDGRNIEVGGNIGFRLAEDGFINIAAQAKDANHARRGIQATGRFYFPLPDGSDDPRESRDKNLNYGGLPDVRSLTLLYNAALPISAGATLYSSSTWSTRKAFVGQSPRRPNSTNVVPEIWPDGFTPFYTLSESDFQVLAGVKGEVGGWSWDVSSTYGENRTRNGAKDSNNAALGPDSPTEFHTFTAKFAQWTNNIDISKGFDLGLAEPVRVSFGVEHRYERFQTVSGDRLAWFNGGYIYPSGPLAGRPAAVGAQGAIVLTPEDEASLSRNSYAGYIDIGLNPVPQWFVAIAGRAEHYDDSAGDTVSGKFTTRYDLNDNFAIRGTVSNGFRAPSLAQSAFAQTSNQNFVVNGVNTIIVTKTVRAGTPIALALGAQPLKPEKSFNLSGGFTVRFGSRFNLSVDAYQIKLNNRIVQTGQLQGAGINAIVAAAGFPDVESVRFFTNAVDTRTRGIEAVLNYTQPLGAGNSVRLTAGYNYNRTKITHIDDSPPELQALGLTLVDRAQRGHIAENQVRSKLILNQDFNLGKFRVNLRETRFGKVSLLQNNAAQDQTFSAKWIVDADISYQLTSNINVGVGANNLFNTYPEQVEIPSNTGTAPYPTQSPFGYYGGYYYGRIAFNF